METEGTRQDRGRRRRTCATAASSIVDGLSSLALLAPSALDCFARFAAGAERSPPADPARAAGQHAALASPPRPPRRDPGDPAPLAPHAGTPGTHPRPPSRDPGDPAGGRARPLVAAWPACVPPAAGCWGRLPAPGPTRPAGQPACLPAARLPPALAGRLTLLCALWLAGRPPRRVRLEPGDVHPHLQPPGGGHGCAQAGAGTGQGPGEWAGGCGARGAAGLRANAPTGARAG